MAKNLITDNNKIGAAILYFREVYHISQSKLCRGLCSIATLSRIEAGARDVDTLLLETLLERLGKTPNLFELILTDLDYILYQSREDIKKQIENKEADHAAELLQEYEKIASAKGSTHMQFIVYCKALINELREGSAETSLELLMEAISYTVPEFKANNLRNYYLSNSELNIIIDIVQRMLAIGMISRSKTIITQVIEYMELHDTMEESNRLYPKIAVIAGKLFLQEEAYDKALRLCNKGIEKNKGSRKMSYVGELSLIKAKASEKLLKARGKWKTSKNECLKLYLQAYYVFDFCGEYDKTSEIKGYLREEYGWEDID